ncbi:MAG: 6-phosphogluconolactonase [Candidatus Obscuribacterales bacterium]|nr:6-phosphogluconolactonase [Candidatus Obscuribacterales bacterium]
MKMKTEKSGREIILCQDKEDLADKAAKSFVKTVKEILSRQAICNLALSGGSTPKMLYARLIQSDLIDQLDWSRIAFFVSDERCVELKSEESNWGNAYRLLLSKLPVDNDRLHPTAFQEENADKSASEYENKIRHLLPLDDKGVPRFDLIYLGMGPDGHTASLFPDTEGLKEKKRLVIKNHVGKLNVDRVSFTFTLINAAARVVFLVAGKDKAPVVKEIIENAADYPCAHVAPENGELSWFLDREAASDLEI